MPGFFLVVSGLPGSGKSTLARLLAGPLELAVVDKDVILERLFQSRGTGDLNWRRQLSRESDEIFMREAVALQGAILVSFWRLAGMPPSQGTPVEWLQTLSPSIMTIHCSCPPDIAAERFCRRTRHPGHLDAATSHEEVVARFRELERLEPLRVGELMTVDTSHDIDAGRIVEAVHAFRAHET